MTNLEKDNEDIKKIKSSNPADDFYRDLHDLLDADEKDKKAGKDNGGFCGTSANNSLYFLYATRLSTQNAKDFKTYRKIKKTARLASITGLVAGTIYFLTASNDVKSTAIMPKPTWFSVMTGCLALTSYFGSIALDVCAESYRPGIIREEELESTIEAGYDKTKQSLH